MRATVAKHHPRTTFHTVSERLYEKSSNTGEPPRHEADHRSVHQRLPARTRSLVVFAHPPVLVHPSDRPLHQIHAPPQGLLDPVGALVLSSVARVQPQVGEARKPLL